MRQVVAIDSGSSAMKALCTQGRDSFPSIARTVAQGEYPDTVTVAGQRWVVGMTALKTYSSEEPLTPQTQRGFHAGRNQHAQVCYALGRLGVSGDQDILVVSLPYGDTQFKEVVERLKGQAEYVWTDRRGEHAVRFAQVRVLPQGVGALCRYKAISRERPGCLYLVDIGSCTVDQVALRFNGETGDYVYIHDKSMSRRDINVTAFYDHWLTWIRRMEGLQDAQPGYYELMDMAQRRDFALRFGRDRVNVEDAFQKARAWFTSSLMRTVLHDMGGFERDAERIILTGGGAQLVDLLAWDDPRLITMDVWANVEGQYLEVMGKSRPEALGQLEAILPVRGRL